MEQEKINLATLADIMASSVSLIGSQAEEVVSPWVMSYVKTVTCDYFASNLENVRVKPISGGYSAAANVQLEIAGKAYVLRVISELESPLRRNTELYAMNHLIDKIKDKEYISIGLFTWEGNETTSEFYSKVGFEYVSAMELNKHMKNF